MAVTFGEGVGAGVLTAPVTTGLISLSDSEGGLTCGEGGLIWLWIVRVINWRGLPEPESFASANVEKYRVLEGISASKYSRWLTVSLRINRVGMTIPARFPLASYPVPMI